MKILMISHEYPPVGGGGANACMHLASEYKKAGHVVKIVTVWYNGTDIIETIGNTTIYRVKSQRKHEEHCTFIEMADFIVKAKPVVDKLEKEEHFDICQVFFGIPSGPLGLYLKKKYKLPYVIRFGGGDIPGFQDRFSKVYGLINPAIKMIWNKADALVANSSGLRNMAIEYHDRREVLVIPNGVDEHAFSGLCAIPAVNTSLDDDGQSIIRLLFVSRLIERKGLQDILPQINEISKECAAKGFVIKLDVVGDGPFGEILKEQVKKEGIEGIVSFHGQKHKSELPYFYSNADIFIFPSRKEGMPNVVLEAMSYGLPIIMTHCEGSNELIVDNGYICNIHEFKERIAELCFSGELRQKMGMRSLELSKSKFSWGRTAEEYLNLFERITGETGKI